MSASIYLARTVHPTKRGGGRPRGPESVLDLMEKHGIGQKAATDLREFIRTHPNARPEAVALIAADMRRVTVALRAKRGRSKRAGGMPALGMRSRQRGLHTAVWPGLETTS
jgi:hypothetical protein